MFSKYGWDNFAQENYWCNLGTERTDILSRKSRLFQISTSPNNLGSFCSTLAQEFIYGLRDNNEQGSTLTGTLFKNFGPWDTILFRTTLYRKIRLLLILFFTLKFDQFFKGKIYVLKNLIPVSIVAILLLRQILCCQWRRSRVFIVNFEHISHLFMVFLLLTLNK